MAQLSDFHYQRFGLESGPKLVFLHGLMGAGANWRTVGKSFQEEFEILLYDQRGHGRSAHQSSYEVEDYADDLLFFLNEFDWSSIHLVGHSMGGRNAFHFASRYPERVDKLVIEDITPAPDASSADRIQRLINLVPTPFQSRKEAKSYFEEGFPKALLGQPQAQTLANYFYTNMSEQSDGTTSWRFDLEGILSTIESGRKQERWQEVEELSMPTLWLRGSESQDLSKEHFERVLSSNSNIEGVEISPSGHWVHFDQAEKFIESLQSFFKS